MSYKIIIELNAEDISDVKIHLPVIKAQIISAINQNEEKPLSPHHYSGMNSGHVITIEKV